ncbi:MAG TPA: hypothetical protein VGR89_06935 [Puia sp.]|nr:hypothetical protein [Puia sp.]
MDKSKIHFGYWHRLLFGNAPAEFMAETLSAQVTITELGIAIMLGLS